MNFKNNEENIQSSNVKNDLVYLDLCVYVFHQESDPNTIWLRIFEYLKSVDEKVNENGVLAIRTTGSYGYFVKLCIDSSFKHYNFINEVYVHSYFPKSYQAGTFMDITDRIFIFSKYEGKEGKRKRNLNPVYSKKSEKLPSWHGFDSKGQGKKMNFSITGEPYYLAPPVGTHWKWKQTKITQALKNYAALPNDIKNDDELFFKYITQFSNLERQARPKFLRLSKTNKPYYFVYGEQQMCNSFWDDIPSGFIDIDPLISKEKIYFSSFDLIERVILIFTSVSEKVLLISNLKETENELAKRLNRVISIQGNISTISS